MTGYSTTDYTGTTTFRQALEREMYRRLKGNAGGPIATQGGPQTPSEEVENRQAQAAAWHAVHEWLPHILEHTGMSGCARTLRQAEEWEEAVHAVNVAFQTILREDPALNPAMEGIGRAMDIIGRVQEMGGCTTTPGGP